MSTVDDDGRHVDGIARHVLRQKFFGVVDFGL